MLTSIIKTKKGIKKTESYHNTIFTEFKFQWKSNIKKKRNELFNLKNKVCQEMFEEETNGEKNNYYLSSVLEEEGDVNKLTEKFMKRLTKTIRKCFRKVRIKNKIDADKEYAS